MKKVYSLAAVLVIIGIIFFIQKNVESKKVSNIIMQDNKQSEESNNIFAGMHCDMIIGDDLSVPPVPTGVAAVPGDRVTWIARISGMLGKNEYKFDWDIEGGIQTPDAPNAVSAKFTTTGPRTPSVKITKVSTGQNTVFTCPTVNVVSVDWPST